MFDCSQNVVIFGCNTTRQATSRFLETLFVDREDPSCDPAVRKTPQSIVAAPLDRSAKPTSPFRSVSLQSLTGHLTGRFPIFCVLRERVVVSSRDCSYGAMLGSVVGRTQTVVPCRFREWHFNVTKWFHRGGACRLMLQRQRQRDKVGSERDLAVMKAGGRLVWQIFGSCREWANRFLVGSHGAFYALARSVPRSATIQHRDQSLSNGI